MPSTPIGKLHGKSASAGPFAQLFAKRPVKPGESYGAPGQGKSGIISIATIIGLFVLWYVAAALEVVDPLFLPGPAAVLGKFVEVWTEGYGGATLLEHTLISMGRVFGAFFLAALVAIPVGILMGVHRVARGIFDPPLEFYRPIPPLAYLPLIVIWFGIGETAKVLLIFLAIFAPVAVSARAGVRSASMEQIHAAYAMGANRRQVIWHVIVKSAMPEILTGLRIGIGFGWTTLVAAEMVAATEGLGFMVLSASQYLVTDVVIMGIVVIGLIALGFDILMRYVEQWLVPWKGKV